MKQWDREQTLQREAYKTGIQNTTELFAWLLDNDRRDDVDKAIKDPGFLSELFQEYEECQNQ